MSATYDAIRLPDRQDEVARTRGRLANEIETWSLALEDRFGSRTIDAAVIPPAGGVRRSRFGGFSRRRTGIVPNSAPKSAPFSRFLLGGPFRRRLLPTDRWRRFEWAEMVERGTQLENACVLGYAAAKEISGGVVRYRALETHLFLKVVSFCSSSRNQYKHQFDELLLKVDYGVWGFGDVHWLPARLANLSLFPRLLPKPCLYCFCFSSKCLSIACLKVVDF